MSAAIFQTFYVSSAAVAFDDQAVRSILAVSRRNNVRLGVTGCLLFSGRCFGQVLEGDPKTVTALTARIAEDDRHRDLRVLLERRRPEREYADWSMGFVHDLNLEDDLETLLVASSGGSAIVAEVMARMRPDTVSGALR